LAASDEKIVAVTAAMPEGTGLNGFRDAYPHRFFDVGIAEAHAVSFAGGLAREGLKPIVAVYSTFLQRAYDQIIEDIALQNARVIFAVDRAGIVGEDGVTHQGIFDIAFTRSVPGLIVMSPKDGQELEAMLEYAFKINRPVAIRYPRSCCPLNDGKTAPIETGKAELLTQGRDFCAIALGSMVAPVREAMHLLSQEGLKGTLINARFIKPIDTDLLKAAVAGHSTIFTMEEGICDGGFGSAVARILQRPVTVLGLPDEFIPHGRREFLLEKYGLSAQRIAEQIKQRVWRK
jgi:1-deoxy-D-xylulose-5-phosphate synthase